MVACFFAAAQWKRLIGPQPTSLMSRSSDRPDWDRVDPTVGRNIRS